LIGVVKKHFTEELIKNKNFKAGNFKQGLIDNFMKMDEIMVQTDGKLELKKEAKKAKEEDEKLNKNGDKKQEAFRQLFDPKGNEDCDIAMYTGCTACVCFLDGNKIYCSNAGDSRAVLCQKGVAIPLSNDHKPDLDTEKNRIYKADGWVSDGRVKGNLNLSRSLGDLEYKQNKKLPPEDQMITAFPELIVQNITPDCEFIIIACDGVWDCKTNQEACNFISERLKTNMKLTKIIEELLDEILATDIYNETGVGCDNMTCIIVQFKKKIIKKLFKSFNFMFK